LKTIGTYTFFSGINVGTSLLSGCRTKAIQSGRSSSPNVILIYRDDLRIGDLSCYGATQVSAPHIDRLAGEGLRFTNAYATSATSTIALWVADRHLSLEKRQYQDCTRQFRLTDRYCNGNCGRRFSKGRLHNRSQLYHTAADPSEKNNVVRQYPDVVKELSSLLDSIRSIN